MVQERLRRENHPEINSNPLRHEHHSASAELSMPALNHEHQVAPAELATATLTTEPVAELTVPTMSHGHQAAPTELPTPALTTESISTLTKEANKPPRGISNRKAVAAIKRPNTRQSQRGQVAISTATTRREPFLTSTNVYGGVGEPAEKQVIKSFSLFQKHRSMEAYVKHANGIHSAYDALEREEEIKFVNSFIQGINSKRNIENLQRALEIGFHRSRTNSEGKVEFLCNWKDIEQALLKVGMIKNPHKRQKAG
jgi:hypothetical protein